MKRENKINFPKTDNLLFIKLRKHVGKAFTMKFNFVLCFHLKLVDVYVRNMLHYVNDSQKLLVDILTNAIFEDGEFFYCYLHNPFVAICLSIYFYQ